MEGSVPQSVQRLTDASLVILVHSVIHNMYSYILYLSLTALAAGAPTLQIKRSLQSSPALAEDFPDPCIIQIDGTWHAFGTQSGSTGHGDISVQHAISTDFSTWTYDDSNGVFPNLPAWATGNVWGPSVIQRVSRRLPC
jgi:hypothetical protein